MKDLFGRHNSLHFHNCAWLLEESHNCFNIFNETVHTMAEREREREREMTKLPWGIKQRTFSNQMKKRIFTWTEQTLQL